MRRKLKVALRSTGLSNQRGVALLVVLWIFIFLFVVAFDFSASVRDEASAAHRYGDDPGLLSAVAGSNALLIFCKVAGAGWQSQTSVDLSPDRWSAGQQPSASG
jgi:hypothetical protein